MIKHTFEDIYNFIVDEFPQYKNNKLNISQMTVLLYKLLDKRMVELTEEGVHHDDWPDDEEIQDLENYIHIINK